MEDDQGPARSHPPAAVRSDYLVYVVHSSFVAVVVQDDDRFPVLAVADVGLGVPRAQEHRCFSLWCRTPEWRWAWMRTWMRTPLFPWPRAARRCCRWRIRSSITHWVVVFVSVAVIIFVVVVFVVSVFVVSVFLSVCFSICFSVRFSVLLFRVLFGFRGSLLGEPSLTLSYSQF